MEHMSCLKGAVPLSVGQLLPCGNVALMLPYLLIIKRIQLSGFSCEIFLIKKIVVNQIKCLENTFFGWTQTTRFGL